MIYFDAGATTLQKPERVRRAMYRAAAAMSSPGRGSYPATRLAEETDFRCRSLAAALSMWRTLHAWCSHPAPPTAEHRHQNVGEARMPRDHLRLRAQRGDAASPRHPQC